MRDSSLKGRQYSPFVTLDAALLLELERFRKGLQAQQLVNLKSRAALALRVSGRQKNANPELLEAWHGGYQLGLMEALGALDEGAELIAQLALERFSRSQN